MCVKALFLRNAKKQFPLKTATEALYTKHTQVKLLLFFFRNKSCERVAKVILVYGFSTSPLWRCIFVVVVVVVVVIVKRKSTWFVVAFFFSETDLFVFCPPQGICKTVHSLTPSCVLSNVCIIRITVF